MNTNSYLMMPVSLIEDLEDSCQRLEELREQYIDLLREAKACSTLVVKGPPREPPIMFTKAPSPEELRDLFRPNRSRSLNS